MSQGRDDRDACVEEFGSVATPSVSGPVDVGGAAPAGSESRYRVGGELGRGAMGVVNAGYDPLLARDVALKRPRHDAGAAQLLRESRVAARLDHPAIPAVLDFVADDGVPVAVLQVRRGVDWRAAVARRGPRPDRRTLRALLEVARAVAHAHERGVLHRDLGPQNVRVDDDDAVSVIDWGLAIDVEDAARQPARVGTPGFTAPEIERCEPATPRSDVWSLGMLLQVAMGVDAAPRPRCPRALEAIWRRATAADPAERYADASDFARDLAAFLDDEPVSAWAEGPGERLARAVRRAPRAAAVVVCAALAVALAAGLVAVSTRRGAEVSSARLLDAAERALAADDLNAAAALLEGAVVVDPADRGRWRGVRAATARRSRTLRESAHTVCPTGVAVDVDGARALCVHDERAQLNSTDTGDTHAALAAHVASVAHVVGGCLLGDGRVVLATAAPGQLATAVTIDAATVTTSPLAGGAARAFCANDAVVQSFDIAAVVRRGAAPVVTTPCPPAVGLVRLGPTDTGDVAVCSDGSLVRAEGGQHRAIPVDQTALAGQSAAALLDDDTLLIGTTHGQVSSFALRREGASLLGRRQLAVGAVQRIDVVGADLVVVVGAAGAAWWRPAAATAGLLSGPTTRTLTASTDDTATTFVALRGGEHISLRVETPVADLVGPDGRSMLLAHGASLLVGDGAGRVVDVDLRRGTGQVLSLGPRRVVKTAALAPVGTLVVGAAGDDGVMFFERRGAGFARVPGPFDDVPARRARHAFFIDDDTLAFLTWSELRLAHRVPGSTGPAFVGDAIVPISAADAPAGVLDIVALAPIGGGAVGVDVDGRVLRFARTVDGAVGATRVGQVPGASAIAASTDGTHILLGRGSELVSVDGARVRQVAGPVSDVALAADGGVAWCTRDGVVGFDDVSLAAHEDRCAAVTFCDNDRAVCSAGWDGRVRVLQR